MRILVVGFPLPNPAIDNYSFIQAPSFYDYDAVMIDVAAVSKVIEEVLTRTEDHKTYAGEPVLNEPSGPFVTGLADHLQRRRFETERLLAAGRTLIVFVRPNAPHSHILGFPGYDRYAWLPAPAGVSYRPPHLMAADGRGVSLVDPDHLLASVVARFQNWFTYRACFSEQIPAFPEFGSVLMRSPGGVPVGIELRVGPGRIVLLPALEDVPSGEHRFELANRFVEALKQTLAGETAADMPGWARDFTLPGLQELEREADEARRAYVDAEGRYQAAQERAESAAGLRRLLWAEGAYSFDAAVREAFRTLGFSLDLDPDRAATLYADGRTSFFESQSSVDSADERVYLRLQRRLEQDMLHTGEAKKGIIVANGQRRLSPDQRNDWYTKPLRVACENYRYALVSGPALFELAHSALEHDRIDHKKRLRDALLNTNGEFVPDPSLTAFGPLLSS